MRRTAVFRVVRLCSHDHQNQDSWFRTRLCLSLLKMPPREDVSTGSQNLNNRGQTNTVDFITFALQPCDFEPRNAPRNARDRPTSKITRHNPIKEIAIHTNAYLSIMVDKMLFRTIGMSPVFATRNPESGSLFVILHQIQ